MPQVLCVLLAHRHAVDYRYQCTATVPQWPCNSLVVQEISEMRQTPSACKCIPLSNTTLLICCGGMVLVLVLGATHRHAFARRPQTLPPPL